MTYPRRMAVSLCNYRSVEEVNVALEDDAPPRKQRRLDPLVLDSLSVDELRLYIDELKTEIIRVEADIGRKQSHRTTADSFFRRP